MNEIVIAATSNVPAFQNKALQTATNKVLKIGETVRKCAFETAYIMAKVEETECYKEDGFNSVHEWAMKTFGFKKSASYTLLRVGKEYTRAIPDAKGKVKGFGSNLLPENSETDFTTTQIEKMLPGGHDMAVELVESQEITPEMTCKEIEKVVQSYLKPESEDSGPESENSEPETEVEETCTDIKFNAMVEDDGNTVVITMENGDKYFMYSEVWLGFKVANSPD